MHSFDPHRRFSAIAHLNTRTLHKLSKKLPFVHRPRLWEYKCTDVEMAHKLVGFATDAYMNIGYRVENAADDICNGAMRGEDPHFAWGPPGPWPMGGIVKRGPQAPGDLYSVHHSFEEFTTYWAHSPDRWNPSTIHINFVWISKKLGRKIFLHEKFPFCTHEVYRRHYDSDILLLKILLDRDRCLWHTAFVFVTPCEEPAAAAFIAYKNSEYIKLMKDEIEDKVAALRSQVRNVRRQTLF